MLIINSDLVRFHDQFFTIQKAKKSANGTKHKLFQNIIKRITKMKGDICLYNFNDNIIHRMNVTIIMSIMLFI